VLANAKWESKFGQNKEMAAAGETLRLASLTTRLKLNEHVGHAVSVTGMVVGEDRIVHARHRSAGRTCDEPKAGGQRKAALTRV
jgi:hypothetical protein